MAAPALSSARASTTAVTATSEHRQPGGEERAEARPHLLRHLDARGGRADSALGAVGRQVRMTGVAAGEVALELRRAVGRHRGVDVVVEDLDQLTTRHPPPPP